MDPYYQHLLPFICGLGFRKAQVSVKKITSGTWLFLTGKPILSGTGRDFGQPRSVGGLLTMKNFLNAAGFLRVIQDRDTKPGKY